MFLHNFRSLEGIPVRGGAIGTAMVFRSAGPLSPNTDFESIHQLLGVRGIVDLREDAERSRTLDWPRSLFKVVELPLFENRLDATEWNGFDDVFGHMVNRHGAQLGRIIHAISRTGGSTLDREAAREAEMGGSTEVGATTGGGLLVHCTAGKDRTGMVVALLLELLGAADAVITADYLRSREGLGADYERDFRALAVQETLPGVKMNIAGEVSLSGLQLARDLISRRGGAESYLLEHGMPESTVPLLREKFVVESMSRAW